MQYKCHIPQNIGALLESVPEREWPENPVDFWFAVAAEFRELIDYASRAQQPQIVFGEGSKAGLQRIWEFYVNDLAQPVKDSINWHGQNTSQWLYAGAIVLQNRQISRHH